MLSRLTLALFATSVAIAVAACSSYGSTTVGGNGIGPNFPSQTLYAANSNQNSVDIYNHGQKSGTGPAYLIGGASTGIDGPQYLAFDNSDNLWITNYSASNNKAELVEIAALATGNVVPLGVTSITGHPRGIAITPPTPGATASAAAIFAFTPNATSKPSSSPSPTPTPIKATLMVVSIVDPTNVYPSQIQLFTEGSTTPYQTIAGPNPHLNVPGGIYIDKQDDIYVANVQGGSVAKFVLPTPSPTPKPTPTPSATPTTSPTPTPSTSPSPSPTPSPTPTPINVKPIFTISGSTTRVVTPMSVAVDKNGNIYVIDQGALGAKCQSGRGPAILEFAAPKTRGEVHKAPIRVIGGCDSKLVAPSDIKVDSSGLIYVADEMTGGAGVIWIYSATASGSSTNAAPLGYFTSRGAVTGIGVVP